MGAAVARGMFFAPAVVEAATEILGIINDAQFLGAHLRLEDDWRALLKQDPLDTYLALMKSAGFNEQSTVYVASGLLGYANHSGNYSQLIIGVWVYLMVCFYQFRPAFRIRQLDRNPPAKGRCWKGGTQGEHAQTGHIERQEVLHARSLPTTQTGNKQGSNIDTFTLHEYKQVSTQSRKVLWICL
jgi:hypothetical protein